MPKTKRKILRHPTTKTSVAKKVLAAILELEAEEKAAKTALKKAS